MSRFPTHQVTDAEDNRQQVVLHPEFFAKLAATSRSFVNPLEGRIQKASNREALVLEGLAKLKRSGPRKLINGLAEWEEEDGLVYHKGRVYVPKTDNLRREVVQQCHDDPTAGHPGVHATLELVERQFW